MENKSTFQKSSDADSVKVGKLVRRNILSDKAFELELARPESFHFIPGQNILIKHGTLERFYAVISAPDEPKIELLIRHVEDGAFTSILFLAEIGTQFHFTGPHGYFTFKPSARPPVFMATGTGVAPFVSMCRSGLSDFTLLHGVKQPEDLYYELLFRRAGCRYIPCISEPVPKSRMPSDAFEGTVTGFLSLKLPRIQSDFYLCGRKEMIQEATLLIDEYFAESRVYYEVFF